MAARHSPHTMNHKLLRAVSTGNADLLAQALGIWSTTTVEQADSSCLESVTADGSSALHIAASHGYLELVVMICTQNISLINSRNNLLDTPLICSARAGHANVVRYLAERALAEQEAEDPVLRARNLDGETAMHEAVRNGHVLVLQKLMSMDNGLAAVVDGKGVSPLYLAVLSDRPDMVDVLIRESLDGVRSTVTVSYSGPDGQTALHAAVYVRKEISESLLRWEPMLAGKVDSYGRTALHYAALACGTGPPLKLLLKNSSLAYIPDNDGLFPVHVAAIAGKADVIRELMEICPNCDELYDKKRRNILHCAVEYKRVKVVWHTFRNPNFSRMMNARDIEGNTPLHLAVKYGHLMIFALLVWDSRVNLSIMNNEGLTPLDVAFSNRHSDHTFHFTSTSIITWLTLCEASGGPCHQARNLTDKGCLEGKELRNYTVVFNIITLISLLMATGSFAAPFIAPLGYIAELEDAFMPVFRGRSGFWIFIIANTMSLVLSTVATCVHANKTTISMRCRLFYLTSAAGLVFGAAMFMLITFTNRWEEYILFWLVSNFAVPLCSWVATSNRPWQNISKVIAAAVLVAMVRSFIITGQLLFKGYCLVNMKPAVGLGARYKVMQTLYTPVEIWPL